MTIHYQMSEKGVFTIISRMVAEEKHLLIMILGYKLRKVRIVQPGINSSLVPGLHSASVEPRNEAT